MTLSKEYVQQVVPEKSGKYKIEKLEYDTDDIIQLMIKVDGQATDETRELARSIPPTVQGMKMIYDFLLNEIHYQRDPQKNQWIKSPARFISEMEGDCKSYTNFTTSIARNLGLDYILNFVSYKKSRTKPYHVYPTVILPDGTPVHIDAVWGLDGGVFGQEKRFIYKKTYTVKPKRGLAYLSGTNEENIIDVLEQLDREIPDSILQGGDVTEMTEGELQRMQMINRMEVAASQAVDPIKRMNFLKVMRSLETDEVVYMGGVDNTLVDPVFKFMQQIRHMNAPAITAPNLRFNISDQDDISGLFDIIKKTGKGIGKGIKKGVKAVGKGVKFVAKSVGKAFKFVWKKLLNFLLKKALPAAGAFYLFTFIRKKVNKEVDRRRAAQVKHLAWMEKTAGMKRSNINAALGNGILQKMGGDPRQVLNGKAGDEISGFVAAGIEAVGWVIKAIKSIAKLFKKKAPKVSENDASDLELIEAGSILSKGGNRSRRNNGGTGLDTPGSDDNGAPATKESMSPVAMLGLGFLALQIFT